MAEEYGKIRKSLMVGIADAIRAKKDTTAIFTPEQMAVEIEGIVTGDDLPDAEGVYFGSFGDVAEYGLISPETYAKTGTGEGNCFLSFICQTAFSVSGLRVFQDSGRTDVLQLWDTENGTKLVELEATRETEEGWTSVMLTNPINLTPGKQYTVSVFTSKRYMATASTCTFNNKISATNWGVGYDGKDVCPHKDAQTSNCYLVDIIIGPIVTESAPNEYKIQAETMNNIANEVKRITGMVGTISTEQIITALQGIATPSTE